jgi:ankyrin repeat protein
LELKADINLRNSSGATSLHLACYNGHKDVAELLLNSGADMMARNKMGATPLHSSCFYGHVDIATLLLDRANNSNYVNEAASQGPWQMAIHTACSGGDMRNQDVTKLLLSRGSNMPLIHQFGVTTDYFLGLFRNWPVTMAVIVLEELCVYNLMDMDSFIDLFEFME